MQKPNMSKRIASYINLPNIGYEQLKWLYYTLINGIRRE